MYDHTQKLVSKNFATANKINEILNFMNTRRDSKMLVFNVTASKNKPQADRQQLVKGALTRTTTHKNCSQNLKVKGKGTHFFAANIIIKCEDQKNRTAG